MVGQLLFTLERLVIIEIVEHLSRDYLEKGYRDKECPIKLRQVLLPKVGGEGLEMVQSLSLKQGVLTDRLQCTVAECGWLQTV